MLELIALTLAYGAVGIAMLVIGFYVVDFVTGAGSLGKQMVSTDTPGAAIKVSATFISIGLIMFFAIYFSGGGWNSLDDAAVFGALGIALQAGFFKVLDLLTPGDLGDFCRHSFIHPSVWAASAADLGIAFIVCAALT